MKQLTVDTNVLRDAIQKDRSNHDDACRLLALQAQGEVDIRITTRWDRDVPSEPLRSQIESLPVLERKPIGTLFRLDFSRLGGSDVLASDNDVALAAALMELLFPKADANSPNHTRRRADVDHLIGHKLSDRDVFLTRDKAILDKSKQLLNKFGIRVMTPKSFLTQHSKTLENRSQQSSE